MPFPVEVVWNDACTRAGAVISEDMTNYDVGIINQDVGWYVGIKDDFVVIAEEYTDEDETYRGITSIPMGDVIEIRKLGRGKLIWPEVKKQKKCK